MRASVVKMPEHQYLRVCGVIWRHYFRNLSQNSVALSDGSGNLYSSEVRIILRNSNLSNLLLKFVTLHHLQILCILNSYDVNEWKWKCFWLSLRYHPAFNWNNWESEWFQWVWGSTLSLQGRHFLRHFRPLIDITFSESTFLGFILILSSPLSPRLILPSGQFSRVIPTKIPNVFCVFPTWGRLLTFQLITSFI